MAPWAPRAPSGCPRAAVASALSASPPVQRFRGGLVCKVHRLCISLNSRLESNKEEEEEPQLRQHFQPPDLRVGLIDSGLVGWARGRSHETRRCRGVTYPESYITKYTTYTQIRELEVLGGGADSRRAPSPSGAVAIRSRSTLTPIEKVWSCAWKSA